MRNASELAPGVLRVAEALEVEPVGYASDVLRLLAARSGIPVNTWKSWDARGSIPPAALMRLATLTGRSMDWLLNRGEMQDASISRASGSINCEKSATVADLPAGPAAPEGPSSQARSSKEIKQSATVADLPAAPPAKPPPLWRPSTGGAATQPAHAGAGHGVAVAEREAPPIAPTPRRPVKPDTTQPGVTGAYPAGPRARASALLPATTTVLPPPLQAVLDVPDTRERVGFEVLPRYLGWAAAAGVDTLWRREEKGEGLERVGDMAFTAEWLRSTFGAASDKLASIYINGVGMAPVLQHGDSVILDTAIKRVDFTGFYILRQRGVARVIKRIEVLYDGSLKMSNDPEGVKAESVPASYVDQLVVVGRVVWPRLG